MSDERRTLLNSKLTIGTYQSVIAIVREEKGDPSRVFLLINKSWGGMSYYERYELNKGTFFKKRYEYTGLTEYPILKNEVLAEAIVVGQCWQIDDFACELLHQELEDQALVHKIMTKQISGEDEQVTRFYKRHGTQDLDEYKSMLTASPFEWAKATLRKMEASNVSGSLPANIEDISDEIPDLSLDFWKKARDRDGVCHSNATYDYAVDKLRYIRVDKPLEQTVSLLTAKQGLFSIGVRQKVHLIEETVAGYGEIISQADGIKATIAILNTPRKNLWTYFFWCVFIKGKLTTSCEFFLIELVNQDAASLSIKHDRLHLNFDNNWLKANIDIGVSSANISKDITAAICTSKL